MKKITVMAFLLALLAPIMSAWAGPGGTTTYNYSASVSVTASGKGTVYVGQNQSATDKTKKSDKQSESESEKTSMTFTFWAFAEPDPGYEFGGWSEGADSVGSATSKVTVSLSSSATSKDVKLTATFNKVLTFDGDEYIIDENGGDLATLLGTVKEGDKIIIKKDVEIAKGVALTIPAGVQVSISGGKTLTVKGSLTIHADARLVGDGTLAHNWKTITQQNLHIPFPLGTDGVAGTGAGVNTIDGTAGKYLETTVKEDNNVTGSFTCKEEFFVTVDNKESGNPPYYSKPSTDKPVGILCTVAREKALNWIDGVSDEVYTDCATLLSDAKNPEGVVVAKTHQVQDRNVLAVLTGSQGTVLISAGTGDTSAVIGSSIDLAGGELELEPGKGKTGYYQFNGTRLFRVFNGKFTIKYKIMNVNFSLYNCTGEIDYLDVATYLTGAALYDSPRFKISFQRINADSIGSGLCFFGSKDQSTAYSSTYTGFKSGSTVRFTDVYSGMYASNPESYLYNDKVVKSVPKGNNTWVVEEIVQDPNVGQVLFNGEESTLANAIANATANSTIVLQRDVEVTSALTLTAMGVQIDLGGFKLTGSNAIINNGDLEIIDVNGNGQIDAPVVNNGTLLLSSAKYKGPITLNSGKCYFLAGAFTGSITIASSVEDPTSVAEVYGGTYTPVTYSHNGQAKELKGLCDNGYEKNGLIAQIPVSQISSSSFASYSMVALNQTERNLYTRNGTRSNYTRTEWIELSKLRASAFLFGEFGVDCAVAFDRSVAAKDVSANTYGRNFDIDLPINANNPTSVLFQAMRLSGEATAPWIYSDILPGGQYDISLGFSLSNKEIQNGTLCRIDMRLATGIKTLSGPMDWSYTEYVTTATRKFVLGAGANNAMIRPETGAATFYATVSAALAAVEDGGTVMLANDSADDVVFAKVGTYTIDANGFAFSGSVTAAEGFTVASQGEGVYVVTSNPVAKIDVETVVSQVVSDEWLEANEISTEDKTEEEVQAAVQDVLNEKDDNGNAKWENLVIGQKADEKAAVTAANGGDDKTANIEVTFEVPKDENGDAVATGYTVKYAFDKVDISTGDVVDNGAGEAKDEPTLDFKEVKANEPTYFKMRAVLEASDDSNVTAEVPVEKTIGVVKVASNAEVTIIPVPWQSLGDGDIKASELVHAASLSDDDELIVYGTDGKPQTWIVKNGEWTAPVAEYTIGGDVSEPHQEEQQEAAELTRGQGAILKRTDTTKEIVLIGQAVSDEDEVKTDLAPAKEVGEPTWNLVASPKMAEVAVGTVAGENTSDEIIVPTAGTPKHYTYKNGNWGYPGAEVVKEITRGGKTIKIVTSTHYAEDNKVPAGTGFWYLNNSTDDSKKISW